MKKQGFKSGIQSSLEKAFLNTPAISKKIQLDSALNERSSFQVLVRSNKPLPIMIDVEAVPGLKFKIRRVGYVPILHETRPFTKNALDNECIGHLPGFVPDPLFEEDHFYLPKNETHAFWISILPTSKVNPGIKKINARVISENKKLAEHLVNLKLHNVRLKTRKNFSVFQWFYSQALFDFYKTSWQDKKVWGLHNKYFQNLKEHQIDTVYVPFITPPINGDSVPNQLLKIASVGHNKWTFDWRVVKKYIQLARTCGIHKFEWAHLFSQWGLQFAPNIYEEQGETGKLLWGKNTPSDSRIYKNFLKQLSGSFYSFLVKEKLLNKSFFHLSDEPRGEKGLKAYQEARSYMREIAPWMKFMDALSEVVFVERGLVDQPVVVLDHIKDFKEKNLSCMGYHCMFPRGRYLNRLIETPLAKIAMHGFLFYKSGIKGFLNWGYNYWYKANTTKTVDPYTCLDGNNWRPNGGWPAGDPFVVYPGVNGPLDSIRWEIFAESLQDFSLLQLSGVPPDDSLFKEIKSFCHFPKSKEWRLKMRKKLLLKINKKGNKK